MKIREEGQNREKVKKEKKHDVHEKRHIVEYYLLRLYSKEDLLEKYGINSIYKYLVFNSLIFRLMYFIVIILLLFGFSRYPLNVFILFFYLKENFN